jgi:hypothetical protein
VYRADFDTWQVTHLKFVLSNRLCHTPGPSGHLTIWLSGNPRRDIAHAVDQTGSRT